MIELKCFYKKSDDADLGSKNFPEVIFRLSDETSLPDAIEAFENFLKAVGYHFDGQLDIVDGEEEDHE